LADAVKALLQAIGAADQAAPKEKKQSSAEVPAESAPKTKGKKQTPDEQARIIRKDIAVHHKEEPKATRSLTLHFKPGTFVNK